MLFRMFLLNAIVFSLQSVAQPITILHIENTRKQPLLIKISEKERLEIGQKESRELVVFPGSNARLQYASGEIQGKLKWGFDENIDAIADKCRKDGQANEIAGISVCEFAFIKTGKSLLAGSTFELKREARQTLPVASEELGRFVRLFSPGTHILYERIKGRFEEFAAYDGLAGTLERAGVLKPLVAALQGLKNLSKSPQSRSQNVLVFGDQGTGDAKALQVAKAMFATCNSEQCNFAISTGDNIYPMAPRITDPDWKDEFVAKFRKIYLPLWQEFSLPFYMTLGNHDIGVDALMNTDWIFFQRFRKKLGSDHFLNQRLSRMKAQVAYTSDQLNPKNGEIAMWNLPNYEYSQLLEHNGIETFVVSLNTNYFPGEISADGADPSLNKAQLEWLEKELKTAAATKSRWRIVFGHHAMFSMGRHGVNAGKLGIASSDKADLDALRKDLLPALCENKVDLYFAGHDHHLEIDEIACDNGHKILHVISGAAAKADAESPWGEWVPFASNAFTAKALYKEFRWGNGLMARDIEKGIKPKRMLGFGILRLDSNSAKLDMIQQTNQGPRVLGCFQFDKDGVFPHSCDHNQFLQFFTDNVVFIGK